jgi:phospholipid transport system substrate-binding protein
MNSTSRRAFLAAAVIAAALAPTLGSRASEASPEATITGFYDTLLAAMKEGPAIGFKGRRDRLAPAISAAFDLPLMTRLMVGPQWASLSPENQQQLIAAFSEFSIATYANRFDDYSGERFQV